MDLFICSECGANLLEVGIQEILIGGWSETDIKFTKKGEKKIAAVGKTIVMDFDEQWVVCNSCGKELHDRTAIDIIEAYENDSGHIIEDEEE